MTQIDKSSLLLAVKTLSIDAGKAILKMYLSPDDVNIEIKADKSPVTEADFAAHQIIAKGLKQLTPNIPILSEEGSDIDFAERSQWSTYWLVDPLDGTKEFIHKTNEFTVNIALIEQNKSTLGVIYAPYFGKLFYGFEGSNAYEQECDCSPKSIKVRKMPQDNVVVAVSRRHGSPRLKSFLNNLGAHELISKGSSLKSCMVASGKADIYPCLGPTSEWDTAAAQAIVNAAGGELFTETLQPLRYNTKASLINPPFIAVGDIHHPWKSYFTTD